MREAVAEAKAQIAGLKAELLGLNGAFGAGGRIGQNLGEGVAAAVAHANGALGTLKGAAAAAGAAVGNGLAGAANGAKRLAEEIGGAAAAALGEPPRARFPSPEGERSPRITAFDPIPRPPQRLYQFLIEQGGLKDEGGELADLLGSRDAAKQSRKPAALNQGLNLRGLVRPVAGLSLDEAALRATEQGFLGAHANLHGAAAPTPHDLLNALEEDLRGHPVYSPSRDAEDVARYREALAQNRDIELTADRFGIPTRGITRAEFADRVAEARSVDDLAAQNASLDDAIEAAVANAEKRAQQWTAALGDAFEPDYIAGRPRTLEEMEHESRQIEAAPVAEPGVVFPGAAGGAAGSARPVEGGAGQGGIEAVARQRNAEEIAAAGGAGGALIPPPPAAPPPEAAPEPRPRRTVIGPPTSEEAAAAGLFTSRRGGLGLNISPQEFDAAIARFGSGVTGSLDKLTTAVAAIRSEAAAAAQAVKAPTVTVPRGTGAAAPRETAPRTLLTAGGVPIVSREASLESAILSDAAVDRIDTRIRGIESASERAAHGVKSAWDGAFLSPAAIRRAGDALQDIQGLAARAAHGIGAAGEPKFASAAALRGLANELDKIRGAAAKAAAGIGEGIAAGAKTAAGAMGTLRANAGGEIRELTAGVDEIIGGRFSRLPGTFTVLLNRSGLLGAALRALASPLGAAAAGFAALAGIAGVFAVEALEDSNSIDRIQRRLMLFGNSARVSAQQLDDWRDKLQSDFDLSAGSARDLVEAFATLPDITEKQAASLAQFTAELVAAGTPQKEAVKEVAAAAQQGGEALVKLGEKLGFSNPALAAYVAALERVGDVAGAKSAAIDAITSAAEKNAGAFDRAAAAAQEYNRANLLASSIAPEAAFQPMPEKLPAGPGSATGPGQGRIAAPAGSPSAYVAGRLRSELGLDTATIAAFLGNIQAESGFNPALRGGIVQERGPRLAGLQSFAGAQAGTLKGQTDYLIHELQTGFAGALKQITAAPAAERPELVMRLYEGINRQNARQATSGRRSYEEEAANRASYARAFVQPEAGPPPETKVEKAGAETAARNTAASVERTAIGTAMQAVGRSIAELERDQAAAEKAGNSERAKALQIEIARQKVALDNLRLKYEGTREPSEKQADTAHIADLERQKAESKSSQDRFAIEQRIAEARARAAGNTPAANAQRDLAIEQARLQLIREQTEAKIAGLQVEAQKPSNSPEKRLAIEQQIAALRNSTAQTDQAHAEAAAGAERAKQTYYAESYRQYAETARAKLEADRENTAGSLAIYNDWLARVVAVYHQSRAEYQRVLREKKAAERQFARSSFEEESRGAERAVSRGGIEQRAFNLRAETGIERNSGVGPRVAAYQAELAYARQLYEREAAVEKQVLASAKTQDQRADAYDKLLELSTRFGEQEAATAKKIADAYNEQFDKLFSGAESKISDALTDAVLGIRTSGGLKDVLTGIEKDVVGGMMKNLVSSVGTTFLKPAFTSIVGQGGFLGNLLGGGNIFASLFGGGNPAQSANTTALGANTAAIAGLTATLGGSTALTGATGAATAAAGTPAAAGGGGLLGGLMGLLTAPIRLATGLIGAPFRLLGGLAGGGANAAGGQSAGLFGGLFSRLFGGATASGAANSAVPGLTPQQGGGSFGSLFGGLSSLLFGNSSQQIQQTSLLTVIAANTSAIAATSGVTAAASGTSAVGTGFSALGALGTIGKIPIIGPAISGIGSFFAGLFAEGGIVPSAAGGMMTGLRAAAVALPLALGGMLLPHSAFAGGGYPAILHPGEMVLPAGLTRTVRGAIHARLGALVPSAAGGMLTEARPVHMRLPAAIHTGISRMAAQVRGFALGGIAPDIGSYAIPHAAGGWMLPAAAGAGTGFSGGGSSAPMREGYAPSGAGGGDVHVHNHFHAPADGASVGRFFNDNRGPLREAILGGRGGFGF